MSERRWYGWGWCGAYFGQEPPRTEDGAADADEDGDGDGLLESEGDGDGRGPRDRPAVQVTSTAWLADGAAEGATVHVHDRFPGHQPRIGVIGVREGNRLVGI